MRTFPWQPRWTRIWMVMLLSAGMSACQPGQHAPAPASKATPAGLTAELRSADPIIRSKAAEGLAGHEEAARDPLLTLLADATSHPESRLYALNCLSKIGLQNPQIRAGVLKSVHDSSADVRQQALRNLIEASPDQKFPVVELKSLLIDVPADVVREAGTYFWAGKISTAATPAEIVELLTTFCQKPDWGPESPAAAFGLLALLQQDGKILPPEMTTPLLDLFGRISDRVPQARRSQLSARLSEISEGPWIAGGSANNSAISSPSTVVPNAVPAPSLAPPGTAPMAIMPPTGTPPASVVPNAPADRFPASDMERAELQTIELACELSRLLLKCGHLNEQQFRNQFRRPRSDPLRLLAERESIRLAVVATVGGYVDALEYADLAGQRDAAAALAAMQPVEVLVPVANRLSMIANRQLDQHSGIDAEYLRSLLNLVGRLGKVSPDIGPILARLMTHPDPRISESALAAIGTMAEPPKVDVPLSPQLLRLIDSDTRQSNARAWALKQLERQSAPDAGTASKVRCILEKIANHRDDPLRSEAIRVLNAKQFPNAGLCLPQIRVRVAAKHPDLWVDRLVFVPGGQVKVVGWCGKPETVDACREVILDVLKEHALLDWAAWRKSEGAESSMDIEPSSTEIEVVMPDFQTTLQQLVLKDPELRNCGVFSSSISVNGDILLTGLITQASQKPRLQQLAGQLLDDPAWKRRLPGRVQWKNLATIPMTDLLATLRQWSERQKLEIWVDRLEVDSSGHLLISGWSSDEGGLPDRLRQHLLELLKQHPLGKFLKELALPTDSTVGIKFESLRPNWSERLRKIAEGTPQTSGISFEKVYYTAQGRLMIEGAQESPEALPAFKTRLQGTLQNAEMQRLLPQGVEYGPFRVQRLDDLLNLFRDALPVHPECDGIRITGARRGPKGSVIFAGEATVLLTDRRVRHLTSVLSSVVGGAKQVAAGVSFEEVKVISDSDNTAERQLRTALTHLGAKKYSAATEPLQIALLHAPDSSTIWFLWGVYHVAMEDTLRARRMLYRAALLEKGNAGRVTARLQRLESYQGPVFGPLRAKATELQATISSHLNDADWLKTELNVTPLQDGPEKAAKK